MKVPIGDFKITQKEKEIINEILDSNRITEGNYTREFENEFAKYIGTKYCVATNSGSGALLLLLLALKEQGLKGKYIITNALSYVATANAIVLAGFEPLFCDCDNNFRIKEDEVEYYLKKYKNDIAAIFPVHLFGYSFNINHIKLLSGQYNVMLLEDAAQAHGSKYMFKNVGTFGKASIFSFYIAHNIQAGELGCICTNDYELYNILKKMKGNGRSCNCGVCTRNTTGCKKNNDYDPRFNHEYISSNFKTTDISSALALVQLKNIDNIIKTRQENVKYLNDNLKDVNWLFLPMFNEDTSYLAYPLIILEKYTRVFVCKYLEAFGIETRPIFSVIPDQKAFHFLYNTYKFENKLQNARYINKNGVYIGCHQYLNKEQLDFIVMKIKEL